MGASPDEVARAFRSRARAAHPDTGGDGEEFIELLQARDALLAHRTPPPAPPLPAPSSPALLAVWIGLLVVSSLLSATGDIHPWAPAEPLIRSAVLIGGFAVYAVTGARPWMVVALIALGATALVALVFTTIGTLLGLLIAVPAVYGLLLMGIRRARWRERLRPERPA